ncbi:hypothetical protein [Streptomyces sp. Je 1-369]|uniref:hypothetical protein n=1 Tax=Streptomyces sp. Je 1-369 TaxID=2966192 RepID=UPI002285D833|nr:hypothetical protein [Streptomyces sp. Je 1-369]WAL94535.1 hypothetical protein NOO62_08485 [Streptomyces sp. Je 1-369]
MPTEDNIKKMMGQAPQASKATDKDGGVVDEAAEKAGDVADGTQDALKQQLEKDQGSGEDE